MSDSPHTPDEPQSDDSGKTKVSKFNNPDQTIDQPAAESVGPEETTDIPRAAHAVPETDRGHETSVRPPVETRTYHPEADHDPNRTGMHTPSHAQQAEAAALHDRPSPAGYEILGELGRGGMGVVYKARQRGLDRVVALKMILAGPHASSAVIARFRAEAQAVARFQHPNLVQVFEVSEFEGMPFFSLEFVDGGTLSKKISREPQAPKYAAETIEQLARAMQYAHDRGIAHRDLKPANILIAPDGTPKITDFGLAKELEGDSGQTQSGQIMGTPSYMAPEQAEGKPDVGAPADVYALGAILYDLLTGRPPFHGSSVLDTLEMVRTREPVPPSELTGKLPRDIETICLKCLQKDIAKRYASAGELAEDLQRYLEGRPILARPVGRAEQAVRWAKRNPAGAGVVGLGFLVVIVSIVFSGFLYAAKTEATGAKVFAQGEQKKAEDALAGQKVALAKEKQAVIDKEKARADEEAAKKFAEGEQKKAELARDAEIKATVVSKDQRNRALAISREVVRDIDNLMKNRVALAPLRLQILNKMLAQLKEIRDSVEKNPLDDRTEAIAYSRIGNICFDSGDAKEAAFWTGRAYGILKTAAEETPNDPAALFNLAAIQNQLADVEWRLGNGTRARELRAAALKARQARVPLIEAMLKQKHKDVNETTLNNAHYIVADSFGLLATMDLRLGDPASAIESFVASDKAFGALKTAGSLDVRRRRAETQARLGDAKLHLRQFDEAEKHYLAALAERETLLKLTKESTGLTPTLRTDIALSRTYLGDFLLMARKNPDAAAAEYQTAFELYAGVLKLGPDLIPVQQRVAAMHYRLGYVARQRSGFAAALGTVEAAHHFGEALKTRAALAKIDPRDAEAKAELMLALGRAGRPDEAEKLAKELLVLKDADLQTRFQAVCGLAVAAGATDDVASRRCKELAFAALADLVRGWKARGQLELDPDLESLRGDTRFATIVAPQAGKEK